MSGFIRRLLSMDAWQWTLLATLLTIGLVSSQWGFPAILAHLRYILFIMLLLQGLRHAREGALKRFSNAHRPLMICLGGFAYLAAASALWSSYPSQSFLQGMAAALVIGLTMTAAAGRWRDSRLLVQDIQLLVILLEAAIAISVIGGFVLPDFHAGGRLRGLFANANTLGAVAALASPALLYFIWCNSAPRRYFYLTALVLNGMALIQSGSRSGLLAALCGVAVTAVMSRRTWSYTRLLYGAVVLVTIAILVPLATLPESLSAMVERTFTVEQSLDEYSAGRALAWSETVALWRQRPWVGHGFRSGPSTFEDRRKIGAVKFARGASHNGFLQVLLELGVVGFGLVYGGLVILLRKQALLGRSTFLSAGLTGGVVAGLAHQVGESTIVGFGSIFSLPFWLIVAGLVASPGPRDRQGTLPSAR